MTRRASARGSALSQVILACLVLAFGPKAQGGAPPAEDPPSKKAEREATAAAGRIQSWSSPLPSTVPLSGENVQSFRMTAYIDVPVSADDGRGGNLGIMGFAGEEDADNHGKMIVNTSKDPLRHGRFEAAPGLTSDYASIGTWMNSPTIVVGHGLTRVDVQYGGNAHDAALRSSYIKNQTARYQLFIDGVLQRDLPMDALPKDFAPKMLSLGSAGRDDFSGKILLARYEENQGLRSQEEIIAELQADQASGAIPGDAIERKLHVVWDGDSTYEFRGSPPYATARLTAAPGVLHTNWATGGALWKEAFGNSFNYPNRVAARRGSIAAAAKLGYRKQLLLFGGGTNGTVRHMGKVGEKIPQAYQDYITLFEGDAAAAPKGEAVPVLVTVKPVGNSIHDEIMVKWANSVRGPGTPCPVQDEKVKYLWKRGDDVTGPGFKYVIDLHAWKPRDSNRNWSNWGELVENASSDADGDGKRGNLIMSGDRQHWTQSENPWASEDVFAPAIERIAELEGCTDIRWPKRP